MNKQILMKGKMSEMKNWLKNYKDNTPKVSNGVGLKQEKGITLIALVITI